MDLSNRNTALCSALVDELARMGIEHACIAPGSRSAPLALAFWNEPRIKTWSIIDERSAGFFAVGIGQATGKPGVVVTTSGTAGANLHPAVAEANEARVPLIVITADRPPELRNRGAGQTIDQLKLYGSDVRWFCELGNIDADDDGLLHFRSTGSRAVAEAVGVTPGPVHLNVPFREPLAPHPIDGQVSATRELALQGRSEGRPLTSSPPRFQAPGEPVMAAVQELVEQFPKGLIVAGRQTDRELVTSLVRLSIATCYPLLAEPTSQARVDTVEHLVCAYDTIFRDLPDHLAPDVVLRFGDMPTSKPLRQWLSANDQCRQLVIDPTEAWNEPTTVAGAIVRADPRSFCEQIETVDRDSGWASAWSAAERAAADVIDQQLDHQTEFSEPGFHRRLAGLLADDACVYVASSMPIRDLEAYLRPLDKSVTFLSNRGANGIDGTISSGLGAAVASGGRAVVLLGDVALYHDMNGLLAMKRNGIDATIVVINNAGGRIFDFLPVADPRPDGYEEMFTTATGLDLQKVAALYDLDFTRVGSYDELGDAMRRPGLIEVPVDGDRNVALHREISSAVSRALKTAR